MIVARQAIAIMVITCLLETNFNEIGPGVFGLAFTLDLAARDFLFFSRVSPARPAPPEALEDFSLTHVGSMLCSFFCVSLCMAHHLAALQSSGL